MENFKASDGRRIAYTDTGGSGPIVLCLSGLTRDSRDFAKLKDHLAPEYRVLTMDYRGRGASEWAADPINEYTVLVEGRDAVELLGHLGIPSVLLLGSSRGGLIGMGLAVQTPGLIKALILNDIGPELVPSGLDFIMTYLGRPVAYSDFDAAAAGLKAAFEGEAPDLTDDDWLDFAHDTYADQDGKPSLSYDPKLRDAVAAAMEGPLPDLWPFYENVDCPVLVIRGANSGLLSPETVAEMKRRKPALRTAEIPNRGHCPFLDEPSSLAAIQAFLKDYA
ncbi:MAG: alpha/beta hydrolase [Pseudomonadota bacterium]